MQVRRSPRRRAARPWKRRALLGLALAVAALVATTEAPLEDPAWWLAGQEPPRVALQGPSGPLRGAAAAAIVREPLDRTRIVAATIDGSPATVEGARVVVDSAALSDGPHRVEVTVRDTSLRQNHAAAVWSFVSDNTAPGLDVRADGSTGTSTSREAALPSGSVPRTCSDRAR